MIPATVVPSSHPIGTLDRIAFCKSVREKRKQLQLNLHSNGKDSTNSSTENAFLTQMLQSSTSSSGGSSSTNASSTSLTSSLDISSLLRKNSCGSTLSTVPSSHRTVNSTLSNILPALLNGTISSPRSSSPKNKNSSETMLDVKPSSSLPVSPAVHLSDTNRESKEEIPTSSSPPRCRSYPMTELLKSSSPPSSNIPSNESTMVTSSMNSPNSYLLATVASCPSLTMMHNNNNSNRPSSISPPLDEAAPKIVRSASVKSCASDSGVSSSSPLSDNNIVFRTNQIESNHQTTVPSGSRKRKSLGHFYDDMNRDKKMSTEANVSSGFAMPSTINNNIPFSQQEAIAIGYAQYALMHTLTQQLRNTYPAALLHAAAASGYLPLSAPMMAAAAAVAAAHGTKPTPAEKVRERRKVPSTESDSNNNHIPSNVPLNDQPYRRETYQTLLESSRLVGQQKLMKPAPIDLRKNSSNRTNDNSPAPSNSRYSTTSSTSTSPSSSPLSISPPKSAPPENNDYVCIPKKLMPVIGARINDWLERSVHFVLSLSSVQDTLDDEKEKFLLLTRIWHRLLLISMVENSFEIYVTKDLQISNESASSPSMTYPTENDVKQIESLISRGKILEIDESGFNLIREVIIYKEGKTLFDPSIGNLFEKAECQAQARLTNWCSTRSKYSKIVFFLCNIYQVKEDIFERLFCTGSMHQSTPIHTHLQRFLSLSSSSSINA